MRCRNHRRRWAGDSGTTSGRGAGHSTGRARRAVRSRPAVPAAVGEAKKARRSSSVPRTVRMRPASRVASRESPPRSKKLSSGPAEGSRSTSANRPHSTSSSGVRGARPAGAGVKAGSGRAFRSSLPAAVSGSVSRGTTAAGTRCSGSRARRNSRTESGARAGDRGTESGPGAWHGGADSGSRAGARGTDSGSGTRGAATTYPTSRAVPDVSVRTATAARATAGWAARTASTSPGSIRKPRTFTWSSARPANSSWPSRRHRTRSPVRYIRSPAAPNGHATKRSAVGPGRCRYPRAGPAPARYSSPTTPGGTGRSVASST